MDFKALLIFIKKNFVSVVSAVVTVGCLVFLVLDMGKKDALDAQFRDLSIEHGRVVKNLKFSNNLETDLEELKALTETIESRLFKPKDLASNYNYFFQLETLTGVKLGELRQKSAEKINPRSKSARGRRKSVYRKIDYTMTASGSMEEVVNFLRHLEGGEAHYLVSDTRLLAARDSLTWEGLSLNINLSILGVKE